MRNSNQPWEILAIAIMQEKWLHIVCTMCTGLLAIQIASVSLTSLEAEYITLFEAVKKAMFAIKFLGSMKIAIKYQVKVRVDNIGAIFMASNISTTCHTKHVDIRYKYVNKVR